jgi:hypothetical protein
VKLKKKFIAGALAAGLAMGAGGIAAAYFTATATGSGKLQVGSATPFTVTQNGVPAYVYPGQTVTTSFHIVNTGGGIQHFTARVTVDVNGTGTIITATTGNAVPGCKASWFTPTVTSGSSGTLNPGASSTLDVRVHMSNGNSTDSTQNACQTTFPKLTVSSGGPAGFALFESDGGMARWSSTTVAQLTLPSGTPQGGAAGIEVLKPGTSLPMNAPTFTTSRYHAGSPRWDIFFQTGEFVFGYPSNAGTGVGTHWAITNGNTYVPWATVLTQYNGKTVTQVFIVMTTGLQPPSTTTIGNVTYGGQRF